MNSPHQIQESPWAVSGDQLGETLKPGRQSDQAGLASDEKCSVDVGLHQLRSSDRRGGGNDFPVERCTRRGNLWSKEDLANLGDRRVSGPLGSEARDNDDMGACASWLLLSCLNPSKESPEGFRIWRTLVSWGGRHWVVLGGRTLVSWGGRTLVFSPPGLEMLGAFRRPRIRPGSVGAYRVDAQEVDPRAGAVGRFIGIGTAGWADLVQADQLGEGEMAIGPLNRLVVTPRASAILALVVEHQRREASPELEQLEDGIVVGCSALLSNSLRVWERGRSCIRRFGPMAWRWLRLRSWQVAPGPGPARSHNDRRPILWTDRARHCKLVIERRVLSA